MSDDLVNAMVQSIMHNDIHGLLKGLDRGVSANASCPIQNVSFLHYAALNNRIEIAIILLDKGGELNAAAGVFNETPVFWSIRRSYHALTELLVLRGADLQHKNIDGWNAVQLACNLDDGVSLSTLFLLLNWGAKSSTELDNSGNSLLGGIIATLPSKANKAVPKALVRMLMRFGEDTARVDTRQNTPLHVLAGICDLDGLGLAFDVYQQPGSAEHPHTIRNCDGRTPYTLAVESRNHLMARFFFDALVFNLLPYWTPAFLAALCVVSTLIVIETHGPFFSVAYMGLLSLVAGRSLLQWFVVKHRSRIFVGMGLGMGASLLASLSLHMSDHVSLANRALGAALVACTLLVAIRCARTRPDALVPNRRHELAAAIIHSAPTAGTDDEALQLAADSSDPAVRSRTRGPVICTQCLCDQRAATLHCYFCGSCVIGQDFHSLVLGTCVGQGNRRIYYATALCGCLCLAHYTALSLWVHTYSLCRESAVGWFWVPAVELCALAKRPAWAALTWISASCCFSLMALLWTAVALVVRRSTYHLLARHGAEKLSPPPTFGEAMARLVAFCQRGDYTVEFGDVCVTHPGGGDVMCSRESLLAFISSTLSPAIMKAVRDRPSVDDDPEAAGALLLADQMTLLYRLERPPGEDGEELPPEDDEYGVFSPPRLTRRAACKRHECRDCHQPPCNLPDAPVVAEEINALER